MEDSNGVSAPGDPYDLGLTLDENEEDFDIEDITDDQVKELLADEENRFLLEEETSDFNDLIDKKSDKLSCINQSSNLITASCDAKEEGTQGDEGGNVNDEYDDEEDEDKDDERRHPKFKRERVIDLDKNKNNLNKKEIPESLESVVLYEKEAKNLQNVKKSKNHKSFKSQNVSKNQTKPLLAQNISSLGIINDNSSSPYKIHVNPHFRAVSAPSKAPLSILNQPNARRIQFFKPRMLQPYSSRMDSKSTTGLLPTPLPQFDLNVATNLPQNLIQLPPFAEQIISNSTLKPPHDPDFQMFGTETSHQTSYLHHESNDYWPQSSNHLSDVHRHPYFNENVPDHQLSRLNNRGQMTQGIRPPFSGSFNNSNISLFKPSLININQVPNPSLSRSFNQNLPAQQSQIPLHELMHQQNFQQRFSPSFIHNKSERLNYFARDLSSNLGWSSLQPAPLQSNLRPRFVRSLPSPSHSGPLLHSTNIPNSTQSHLRPHHSSSVLQQPCLPQSLLPLSSRTIKSQPSAFLQNQIIRPLNQNLRPPVNKPLKPSLSINKSNRKEDSQKQSLSSTVENLKTTSDVTIKIKKDLKQEEEKKISSVKNKSSKRFLHKKANNRDVASVKQTHATSSEKSPEQKIEKQEKMNIDLIIDDEYKRKLEEQKQLREKIIRQKEERRRKMVAEKMKKSEILGEDTSLVESQSSEKQNPISSNQKKKLTVGNKSTLNNKSVIIKGLAVTTNKTSIVKLCNSIGPIENCKLDDSNIEERKAVVTFKNPEDAVTFQRRYQRHLLDLCVIQVTLLW